MNGLTNDYIYYHSKDEMDYTFRFYNNNFVIYSCYYFGIRFPFAFNHFIPTREGVTIGCFTLNGKEVTIRLPNRTFNGILNDDNTLNIFGENGEEFKFKYFSTKWKEDWFQFQGIITQHQIKSLYHFTDRSNLSSIQRNGGLFSWQHCYENNIIIPSPSGDELSRSLDERYGLQDYVRVCFTKNHPMMYTALNQRRISDPIILEISSDVIYIEDTLFSNMNATRRGHSIGGTLDHFNMIKFDIVLQETHFDIEDEMKKYYQAEVLIKNHIPLSYITEIHEHVPTSRYSDYEDDYNRYF